MTCRFAVTCNNITCMYILLSNSLQINAHLFPDCTAMPLCCGLVAVVSWLAASISVVMMSCSLQCSDAESYHMQPLPVSLLGWELTTTHFYLGTTHHGRSECQRWVFIANCAHRYGLQYLSPVLLWLVTNPVCYCSHVVDQSLVNGLTG